MANNTIKIFLISMLSLTFLHSEDLANRYKQMMHTAPIKTKCEVSQGKPIDSRDTIIEKNYNLSNHIKKIQALKQGTFESTSDFNSRVNSTIKGLENEVKFFAKNGSKEYDAGTATMMKYNADKEVMQLKLKWNEDLKSTFSEIKDLKTVSLNISKDEAKALFEKQKTHYFHIDLAYIDSKLIISKIILNDKYEMRKLQNKSKNITAPTPGRVTPNNNPAPKISSSYEGNENITLDFFLHKFYKAGEENLASKALPYYAYNVDRYFSMRNVTRKDILKDKKRYYKKWVKRKYHLLNYKIINSSHTDRAILYTVKSTIYWEVTSVKGKVRHGTSTNTINLYHDHSGIVVTSIK